MGDTTNYKHWYEINPSRLEMEKMVMAQLFPDFKLTMVDDGRLRYSGTLQSDQFKRETGYSVNLDYYDSGEENCYHPGIVISPITPSYNELFSNSLERLQTRLHNQVAISMKCVCYDDPPTPNTKNINTAASLLKKAIAWFKQYETEKIKADIRLELLRKQPTSFIRLSSKEELNSITIPRGKITPPYDVIIRWYDLSPELYVVRLSYLKQFFPQFTGEIKRGGITGLIIGNILLLSGPLSIGVATNPKTGKTFSYDIRIIVEGYHTRTYITISPENIDYIKSFFGYLPVPFEEYGFINSYILKPSLSTLYDAVYNVYEWLSLIEYGLIGTVNRDLFCNPKSNVPKVETFMNENGDSINGITLHDELYYNPNAETTIES